METGVSPKHDPDATKWWLQVLQAVAFFFQSPIAAGSAAGAASIYGKAALNTYLKSLVDKDTTGTIGSVADVEIVRPYWYLLLPSEVKQAIYISQFFALFLIHI